MKSLAVDYFNYDDDEYFFEIPKSVKDYLRLVRDNVFVYVVIFFIRVAAFLFYCFSYLFAFYKKMLAFFKIKRINVSVQEEDNH